MFRCQSGYTLQKIKDTYYLLPYGQQIADHKKALILNETSAFLWDTLQQLGSASSSVLTDRLAAHYPEEDVSRDQLLEDVSDLLSQMASLGFLIEELRPSSQSAPVHIKIAGLSLLLCGDPALIPPQFAPFRVSEPAKSDAFSQKIEWICRRPFACCDARVLLQNEELAVLESSDRYLVRFPQSDALMEAQMTKDGSLVQIFYKSAAAEVLQEEIFHAIRLFFLFLAQKHGLFAMHSASILYRGKAWLFSGHSGMGKTTHTSLWHTLFQTPYLNGDLNLIGIKDGTLLVYGIPWCGTSGLFTAETHVLGGIVLLGRDNHDHFVPFTQEEKVVRVLQRLISPAWTAEQLLQNLNFSNEVSSRIPILQLLCTKQPSAAQSAKAEIDRLEDLP